MLCSALLSVSTDSHEKQSVTLTLLNSFRQPDDLRTDFNKLQSITLLENLHHVRVLVNRLCL